MTATKIIEVDSKTVERLRASKLANQGGLFNEGFEAGQEWAKNRGEAWELINLEQFHDEIRLEQQYDWDWFFSDEGSQDQVYTTAESLYFKIDPDQDKERSSAREFWAGITEDDKDDKNDWLRGFAEGALAIWEAVKTQI